MLCGRNSRPASLARLPTQLLAMLSIYIEILTDGRNATIYTWIIQSLQLHKIVKLQDKRKQTTL